MKKLDKTKVYDLRDLSNEQYVKLFDIVGERSLLKHYFLFFNGIEWRYTSIKMKPDRNALTLFETNKNDRIIEIQLRMQELNNEILELYEELTRLTYEE